MTLLAVLYATDIALSELRDMPIAWRSYIVGLFSSLSLLGIGFYIRAVKDAPQIAKIIISFTFYSLFGMAMTMFFQLHMPRPEPVLDEFLVMTDSWFGYHWPDAVAWVATIPNLGPFLETIYTSSFIQIFAVLVMLGYLGRFDKLDKMLLTNAVSLLLVFAVWQTFPNLSLSTYHTIPTAQEIAVNLRTDTLYGQLLLEAATDGFEEVSFFQTLGFVAFPSYHMVMLMLVVWFSWKTMLFWPIFVASFFMVPGILIHGAHHIADVFGGAIVFFIGVWISNQILARVNRVSSA